MTTDQTMTTYELHVHYTSAIKIVPAESLTRARSVARRIVRTERPYRGVTIHTIEGDEVARYE